MGFAAKIFYKQLVIENLAVLHPRASLRTYHKSCASHWTWKGIEYVFVFTHMLRRWLVVEKYIYLLLIPPQIQIPTLPTSSYQYLDPQHPGIPNHKVLIYVLTISHI